MQRSKGRGIAYHFDGVGHLTPAYLDTSGPLSSILDVRGTSADDSFGLGNLWGDQGFEWCGEDEKIRLLLQGYNLMEGRSRNNLYVSISPSAFPSMVRVARYPKGCRKEFRTLGCGVL